MDLQKSVKETLKAYNRVNVTFENNEYHASAGVILKQHYAPDFKVLGWIHADDVYSKEEQVENYINEFFSYPTNYKGKRDYDIIRKMQDERVVEDDAVVQWFGKLNGNGDFELVEKVRLPLS